MGNMLNVTLPKVLLFLLLILSCMYCLRTDCRVSEGLCGDKCYDGLFGRCICGNETIDNISDDICCNYSYCFQENDFVQCDGQKQSRLIPCEGKCIQKNNSPEYLLCNDGQQCVNSLLFCKGSALCNE